MRSSTSADYARHCAIPAHINLDEIFEGREVVGRMAERMKGGVGGHVGSA